MIGFFSDYFEQNIRVKNELFIVSLVATRLNSMSL